MRDGEFGRPGSLCFPALPNPQARNPNPASSSERIPELLPELRVELVEVEALVLRPRVFDLERTHQIADAADGQPVAALLDAADQAGATGVAAAGGVGDAALVRGRHVADFAVGVESTQARSV